MHHRTFRLFPSLRRLPFCLLLAAFGGHLCAAFSQYDYTVVRPRERSSIDRVTYTRKATQATKGILAILLEPILAGKITVTDARGKVVDEIETDATEGRAEIELRRGQAYVIRAVSPGFLSSELKTKVLKNSQFLRVKLTAQYARLELPGLPNGATVFIDDKAVATADASGRVALANLASGAHKLLVRHPEYNDYEAPLPSLEPGTAISFFPLSTLLVKVAKLTLQALPNAAVMIDGAMQGRVNANGQVNIDYALSQAGEHELTVELLGYEPWRQTLTLAPGPRMVEVRLTPIITSAGTSDAFDSLSLWAAPPTWKILKAASNSKLVVSGNTLGVLKDKLYRNFEVHFTLWLADGKGATWAVRADKAGKRYYLFHLTGANAVGDLTPRRFYTYLVQDGVVNEVNTPTTVLTQLNAKDSYTIRLTVKDFVMTHEITSNSNGELNDLGVYTDTSDAKERSLFGGFGFLSFKGEVFHVDDFNLEPKP